MGITRVSILQTHCLSIAKRKLV